MVAGIIFVIIVDVIDIYGALRSELLFLAASRGGQRDHYSHSAHEEPEAQRK